MLISLHESLAVAKEQLSECLAACSDSGTCGVLVQLVGKIEDEYPDIRMGGVLATHVAGQELSRCKARIQKFLRAQEDFEESLLASDLQELSRAAKSCYDPPNDNKLYLALKQVLQKRPDARTRDEVRDAQVLLDKLTKQVLQGALDLSLIHI